MLSSLMKNTALPALEQTVNFAAKRHSLLASNLANMDTPDYQSRDISVDDFQSTLRSALQSTQRSALQSPQGPDSRYATSAQSKQASYEQVRDVSNQIQFHDGSDVSLEHQVTEVAKNQSMHNTAIALMRSQFQTLKAAISESANV